MEEQAGSAYEPPLSREHIWGRERGGVAPRPIVGGVRERERQSGSKSKISDRESTERQTQWQSLPIPPLPPSPPKKNWLCVCVCPLFPTTPLFPHLTVATAEVKSTFPPSLSPHLALCNLIGRRRNFPSLQLSASFVPSLLLLLFVDVAAGAAQCQSLSRKLDVDPSSHPKSSSGFPPFFVFSSPPLLLPSLGEIKVKRGGTGSRAERDISSSLPRAEEQLGSE